MILGRPIISANDSVKKVADKGWLLCLPVAVFFGVVTAIAGGMVSVAVLISIVVAGFTLANYRIGLWLLVFLLPLSATAIFPREILGITGANPFNALFGLTLLSFFADRLWKQKAASSLTYPRFWWAYLAPIGLAALIGVQHVSEIPAFAFSKELIRFNSPGSYLRDILIKPLIYLMLAFLLGAAGRSGMKPTTVIAAMCLSIWLFAAWVFTYVVMSGIGLGQLASATSRESLSGTGMHANDLGALAASMLTLMIFAIANADKTRALRGLYVMTAVISGALLLISFSRGAFLSFAVGLTVFFIAQRRLKIVIVALIALACILPILPVELYERLSTGVNTGGTMVLHSSDDPLTAGRVAGVWMPLLSEVQSHPVFGNGLLSIAWSLPFRSGALGLATLNPHNLYLKILLEIGLVGLVLVMLFFIDFWRRLRAAAADSATPRNLAWLFMGASAALMGYAGYGMSGGDYLPDPSNAMLWVIWGLLLAVSAGRRLGAAKGDERLSPAGEAHAPRNGSNGNNGTQCA
jgi:O-antigen ligase